MDELKINHSFFFKQLSLYGTVKIRVLIFNRRNWGHSSILDSFVCYKPTNEHHQQFVFLVVMKTVID
jgi:hypothetical protein